MRNSLLFLIALSLCLALGCGGTETAGIPKDKPNPPFDPSTLENSNNVGRVGGGDANANQEDETADENTEENADESSGDDASENTANSGDTGANPPGQNANTAAAPPRNRGRNSAAPWQASLGRAGGGVVADSSESADIIESETPVEEDTATSDDSAVANNDTPAPVEPAKPARKTFFERAILAFQNEHEHEAFQFLYAHALTEDGALSEHPLAFYPGISAPRIGLRWAVGIEYDDGGTEGDPPVIGDNVASSGSTSSGSGGVSDGSNDTGVSNRGSGVRGLSGSSARGNNFNRGSGGNSSSTPTNVPDAPGDKLVYYTGDFGSKLINRFEMRRKNAYFGQALNDVNLDASFDEPDEPAQQASTPPASGGDYAISGPGARNNRPGRNNNNNSNDEDLGYTADATSLSPGVLMLGVNRIPELIEDAKSSGVDMLIVFDVSVKERRDNKVSYTKAYVYRKNIDGEFEEVHQTKTLNTTAVATSREKGGEPVEVELDKMFQDVIDVEYRADAMPDIDAESISQWVDWLIEQEHANPLPVMVEIKNYEQLGLITKKKVADAFAVLIGTDATRELLDGELSDREKAISKWLPGKFRSNTSSNFR